MKTLWVILITILSYSPGYSTTFYLSMHGSDAWDGKNILTPWRTLDKLGKEMTQMIYGDSVLLERESIFYGTINIWASGIYLGDYGVGCRPVIHGSIELKSWKKSSTNIWISDCNNCAKGPYNLFLDGEIQRLGRFPNEGYLTITRASTKETTLNDTTLNFKNGYWNNGELVLKSSRWTIDNLIISRYVDKTFYSEGNASYPLQAGFGYFIQNHPSTLDQQGEWYFNKATRQVYLYLNAGETPFNHTIAVSIETIGLSIANQKDIVVENLSLTRFQTGARLVGNTHLTLKGVYISYSGENGLDVTECDTPVFTGGEIANSNNNGVLWHNNTKGEFSLNSVCNTGLFPGRGIPGNGSYIGLFITSDEGHLGKNTFSNNIITKTGYSAVDFRTGHTWLINNMIDDFCLTKDDGAGIYTWHNAFGDNKIEGNTITSGTGSADGTLNHTQLLASGIYIDDESSHILIKGNAISNCALAGIYLHNATSITLTDNKVMANGNSLANRENGQLLIRMDSIGIASTGPYLKIAAFNNQWIASTPGSYCIFLYSTLSTNWQKLGFFHQNTFSSNYPNQVVANLDIHSGLCFAPEEYTLAEWQALSHGEMESSYTNITSQPPADAPSNLIVNGNIDNSIMGWMIWPSGSILSQDKLELMNGPSLKVELSSGNTEVLVYHQGFSLSENKLYLLSFIARSYCTTRIEFAPLEATLPWGALGAYTCFSISTSNKRFNYFFTPHHSSFEARINFKSNQSFWIDDVRLVQIN